MALVALSRRIAGKFRLASVNDQEPFCIFNRHINFLASHKMYIRNLTGPAGNASTCGKMASGSNMLHKSISHIIGSIMSGTETYENINLFEKNAGIENPCWDLSQKKSKLCRIRHVSNCSI